jgi:bacterioferritin
MKIQSALIDTAKLRQRARSHAEEGAVTAGYGADRKMVLKLLNDSLATELDQRASLSASPFHGTRNSLAGGRGRISGAFERRAGACGSACGTNSAAWRRPGLCARRACRRSHAEYVEGATLSEMIREPGGGTHRHRQLSGLHRLSR